MKSEISKRRTALYVTSLIICSLALNLILHSIVEAFGLPLFLDAIGTALTAMLGGVFPAIFVGFLTNLAEGIYDLDLLYFGVVNVLLAVAVAYMFRRKAYKRPLRVFLTIVILVIFCATVGTVINYFIGVKEFTDPLSSAIDGALSGAGMNSAFLRLLFVTFVIEAIDKTFTVLAALLIFSLISPKIKTVFDKIARKDIFESDTVPAKRSLLTKAVIIVIAAEFLLGALACLIGFFVYRNISIRKFTEICTAVVDVSSEQLDPEHIDAYIEQGRELEEYSEIEERLYGIKNAFTQIEYVYCYRIEKEGCRVVFDLATEELDGSEIGSIVEFDESFEEYLPTLFAGGEIDPIITDDSYGWLLTVYKPVKNSKGECVCYMAADIQMGEIVTDETVFLLKMISLFFGLSVIIIGLVFQLVKKFAVLPIDAMAKEAESFAFETEEGRSSSIEKLKELQIDSKDEIENLYTALTKLAVESTEYIDEVKKKSETITRMQEGIILDFAEMVEARDKCTGDHIKKTSHYVEAIAREMQRRGDYPDILNEEYIDKLKKSAPLHDVGKIKISDLILNKPGRLTDEEFELMKTHTTEGKEILANTSSMADAESYLKIAVEMAWSHHERWDGTGYPQRLKGGEIPLSARIMAVADVFDALVSERSYKKPFSFEKATDIIREESGTHFDPKVAEAFLAIAKEAYN